MNDLTDRQREVFDYFLHRFRADGVPPTVREVGKYFDIGVNGAQCHIKALEKKKVIRKSKRGRRCYVPVVGLVCPCCGRKGGRR